MRFTKPDLKFVANCVSLLMVFAFISLFFTPNLMLSETTTTGGDMGSHYVLAHYLRNHLLPQGKLIGWYPNWMAGIPMFQFYFVPPYLLMSILSIYLPLEVAFKLVTVLGIFLLPLTAYLTMYAMKFEFPAPAIAAGFSTLLLFLETYSQWGGNIPSTLAGEFSYMLSFSLSILFIGCLYRGIDQNRHIVLNSVLLSCVVLTHIYTAIFVTVASMFFLLVSGRSKNLLYLAKMFMLAGMISSFWAIPLLVKMGFSAAPKDVFYGFPSIDKFINPTFSLFYMLAAVSIASGIINKDRRITYCLWMIFSLVGLILSIKHINLLYIRFISFIYFIPLLMAADGLGRLSRGLKARWAFPIIVVLFTLVWVNFGVSGIISESGDLAGLEDNSHLKSAESFFSDNPFVSSGVTYIPHWIKWNYEGLEGKDTYDTFKELNDYLRDGNLSGRVDFEYSGEYNRFGTPRVFEVSPVFSNKSVMESLLLESSLTFPFFYYIQKEMSQSAWWPGFPLEMPEFDPDSGAESLRLYNVQYFIASSEKTKNALDENKRYRLIKEINGFNIYAVNEDSHYVEALKREPVLVITDEWKQFSYDWISMGYKDVPLVFSKTLDGYDIENFRLIVLDKSLTIPDGREVFYPENIVDALENASEVDSNCIISEELFADEIRIHTNCVGKPLIVKVSYFPNWKVDGAKKIYIASPSLMLIIPQREDVRIYYGETLADQVGNTFSILGILAVIYWIFIKNKVFRKRIHVRFLEFIKYEKINKSLKSWGQHMSEEITKIIPKLKRNWRIILFVVFVLIILSGFLSYLSEKKSCDDFCTSRGFFKGEKHFRGEVIDHFDFGYSHQQDNLEHNLECTASCDKSRDDMVYVSGGYVEFDMSVLEGIDNSLVLRMWDNVNCRSGDIYIDGVFAARIDGNGKFGWKDFEFRIAKEYLNSSKIRVRLEHVNTDCHGWDLSDAYIHAPNCVCY